MNGILTVLEDLENTVGTDRLLEYVEVKEADLPDGLVRKLYTMGVKDTSTLMTWIARQLGRAIVLEVLRHLGLEFPDGESVEDLCERWFSYRGIGEFLRPRARPHALADFVVQMAEEVTCKGTLEPHQLVDAPLATVLRFTSLFYAHELVNAGRPPLAAPPQQPDEQNEVADLLAGLSLEDLCTLLNCETPVRAQPYDRDQTTTIILASGAAGPSLTRIAELAPTATKWSDDQKREFSQCALDLLRQWRGPEPLTPKACAVAEIQGDVWRSMSCRDESGATVTVSGLKNVLDRGEAVLLRAADEDELWAPQVQSIPIGAAWETPQAVSPAGKQRKTMQVRRRDKVFISYSHEDDVWLQLVRRHLKPYSRHMQLQVWDDSRIKAGDPWREGIEEALASAQVAVLLVTPAFLDSEFIASVEVPRLLDDARHEGVRILWIPVRPSGYRVTPIERYQAVHPPDRPLASLKDWERDAALVEIASIINEQYRA